MGGFSPCGGPLQPAPAYRSPASRPVPRDDGDIIFSGNLHPGSAFPHVCSNGGHSAHFQLRGRVATETDTVNFFWSPNPARGTTVPGGHSPDSSQCGAITAPTHTTPQPLSTAEPTLALSVSTTMLLSRACSFPRLPSDPHGIP